MSEDPIRGIIPYEHITDFISQGLLYVMGDHHIYMQLTNHVSKKTYSFHLPMSLWCAMIKSRIIGIDRSHPAKGHKQTTKEIEEELKEALNKQKKENMSMFR